MSKKNCKCDSVDISIILDRSGSMHMIWDDTLGGVNAFIKEQAEQPGEATFTLTAFDTDYDVIVDTQTIQDVKTITNKDVWPRGGTALLDAIGKTVSTLSETKSSDDVIVVIVTDGYENSSQEWKPDAIKELIEEKEKAGWKFIYLGANQDAWAVGGGLGVVGTRTLDWDHTNVGATYGAVGQSVSAYRTSGNDSDLNTRTFKP